MTGKIISVFGSTGLQGGAVVNALLKDGTFKVRALTRNVESPSAKKLVEKGAQVATVDLNNDVESIAKVLQGSYGVYLVTDFWSLFEKEEEIGKKVVDAALKAGVQHFIYSSLANTSKISNGKIVVPEFDMKAHIEDYARQVSAKHPEFISSFVHLPYYAQGFNTDFLPITKIEEDKYFISFPISGKPMELIDVNDVGPIALAEFKDPKKYSGVGIHFTGSALSGPEIAEKLSKATGKSIIFKPMTYEEYLALGFPGVEGIADMFKFVSEYGSYPGKDSNLAKEIIHITTFDEYLEKNPIQLK
ncbi:hypothetical protein CYY_001035 [Polysphondylium violaceum]|uniref:NmrA-like domain-containing protein n=1 Tax=Polysphondylium violaceum TaxID=133409 RepID=A0A8J4Q0G5_9MYCE|nr:hypothetical protein CYY_001035 [Polysphondylium violaceum]